MSGRRSSASEPATAAASRTAESIREPRRSAGAPAPAQPASDPTMADRVRALRVERRLELEVMDVDARVSGEALEFRKA